MKIIQLQYFVEVVKTNNISKAAKNLYVSQPAISFAIRELEKEFNTSLLIRYNNQITLTDEGHFLYRQALGLLENQRSFWIVLLKALKIQLTHKNKFMKQ